MNVGASSARPPMHGIGLTANAFVPNAGASRTPPPTDILTPRFSLPCPAQPDKQGLSLHLSTFHCQLSTPPGPDPFHLFTIPYSLFSIPYSLFPDPWPLNPDP